MNHIPHPRNLLKDAEINFIQDGHHIIARIGFDATSKQYVADYTYRTKEGEKSIAYLPQKIIDKIILKNDKLLALFGN